MTAAMERLYADVGHYDASATADSDYMIHECPSCRLLYQAIVPGPELMAAIYGHWHDSEKTRRRLASQANPQRALQVAREVALAWALTAPPDRPPRILDYGCGLGQWAGMAVAFGAETWGVEFSPERRDHCAALGIRMTTAESLQPDNFDYIQLDQVLEHLVEPAALLRKLRVHLRPGGVICVAVPSARRTRSRLSCWRVEFARPNLGALMPLVPLLHLNGFTHDNLRRLAEHVGLELVCPSWRQLLTHWTLVGGAKAVLKSLALPFYLRSRFSTRLYFRRPC